MGKESFLVLFIYLAVPDLELQHAWSSSLTRDGTLANPAPALGAQSLSHRTTREVHSFAILSRSIKWNLTEKNKSEWSLKVNLSGVFKEQQEVCRVEWKGRIPEVEVKDVTEVQILQDLRNHYKDHGSCAEWQVELLKDFQQRRDFI